MVKFDEINVVVDGFNTVVVDVLTEECAEKMGEGRKVHYYSHRS